MLGVFPFWMIDIFGSIFHYFILAGRGSHSLSFKIPPGVGCQEGHTWTLAHFMRWQRMNWFRLVFQGCPEFTPQCWRVARSLPEHSPSVTLHFQDCIFFFFMAYWLLVWIKKEEKPKLLLSIRAHSRGRSLSSLPNMFCSSFTLLFIYSVERPVVVFYALKIL